MSCVCKIPSFETGSLNPDDFCIGEVPGGAVDCDNLDFTTAFVFEPTSLEVLIDGVVLSSQEYQINAGNQSFTLILNPDNPLLRATAPSKSELISVNYIKAPVDTGPGCVVYL